MHLSGKPGPCPISIHGMPDKLYFFSKSKPNVPPGQGVHEHVEDVGKYAELSAIPNWRWVLSNFHQGTPFVFRGARYNTIEHAFQAAKIHIADPSKAFEFCVESGSELAMSGGLAARKARKRVLLSADELMEWDSLSPRVMREATEAKYMACALSRKVLVATRDAELWHIVPRAKPVRFHHLEDIRAHL